MSISATPNCIPLTIRTRPRTPLRPLQRPLPLAIRTPRTIIRPNLTLPVLIHRVLHKLLRIHVLLIRLLLLRLRTMVLRLLMARRPVTLLVATLVRLVIRADQTLDGRTSCRHDSVFLGFSLVQLMESRPGEQKHQRGCTPPGRRSDNLAPESESANSGRRVYYRENSAVDSRIPAWVELESIGAETWTVALTLLSRPFARPRRRYCWQWMSKAQVLFTFS